MTKCEKWQGRARALTFSFDDGVTQDRKTVELLNKYGLKATFNLNSGMLGEPGWVDDAGVRHDKIEPSEVATLYLGHEVAVHTITHPNLTELPEDEIVHQVEDDRIKLSELCGYEVIGMAYPCGGVNNDDRVAEIIKRRTGVKYSRTITSSLSFADQENLLRFNPTVYHAQRAEMLELVDRFLAGEEGLLYIWGHTYEFDYGDNMQVFEEVCRKLAGHDDIFYCTNKEAFFGA